jgi:caa(3)-type oxidase subunit IV
MTEAHAEHSEHAEHADPVKIWGLLVVLLTISVLGPLLEIRVVTLVTAFGIAVVKAYMVAKHFMEIDLAKRYVTYLVATCLVFMLLFFAGSAPDVMKSHGSGWVKPAWQQAAALAREGGSTGAAHHH